MICWAIVMTLMGLVTNFAGLVATRFLLGLCESGLFPGICCKPFAQSRVRLNSS